MKLHLEHQKLCKGNRQAFVNMYCYGVQVLLRPKLGFEKQYSRRLASEESSAASKGTHAAGFSSYF